MQLVPGLVPFPPTTPVKNLKNAGENAPLQKRAGGMKGEAYGFSEEIKA